LAALWSSRLVATAAEDRLSVATHTSFAAAAIAEQSAIYECTPEVGRYIKTEVP
jgi:hypothetical protein